SGPAPSPSLIARLFASMIEPDAQYVLLSTNVATPAGFGPIGRWVTADGQPLNVANLLAKPIDQPIVIKTTTPTFSLSGRAVQADSIRDSQFIPPNSCFKLFRVAPVGAFVAAKVESTTCS